MPKSRFAWGPVEAKIEGLCDTLRRLGPMPTKRLLKQSGLTRGTIRALLLGWPARD